MMQPVVAPMQERLQTIALQAPRIPILSTVTGAWLSDAQACDPTYWAEHLRLPVRFAPAVSRLLESPGRVLLEIGPVHARAAMRGERTRRSDRDCQPG